MIGYKSLLAVCMLCALVLSAFGAANAAAEPRAYLCYEGASTKDFSDAHCLNKATPPSKFGHGFIGEPSASVGVTNGDTASGTTASTPATLRSTIAGVEVEVRCTTAGGMGLLTNEETYVKASGTIEYTSCTVAKPAGKGCAVKGGAITTNELALSNLGQGAGSIKLSPVSGTEFASVVIEKCSVEPLNGTFPVAGSLIATMTGATVTTSEAGLTAQGTLKLGGSKAGLESALTVKKATELAITLT